MGKLWLEFATQSILRNAYELKGLRQNPFRFIPVQFLPTRSVTVDFKNFDRIATLIQ